MRLLLLIVGLGWFCLGTLSLSADTGPRYIFRITADFGDMQRHCNGVATAIQWRVITAAHCVATRDGRAAEIHIHMDDEKYPASHVTLHKDWLDQTKLPQAGDMALLHLPSEAVGKIRSLGAPRILSTGSQTAYNDIRIYGFEPLGGYLQAKDCEMERVGVRHSRIHTCQTQPGFSGAPIFYLSDSNVGQASILIGFHTRTAGKKGIARVFTKDELATLLGGADDYWVTLDVPAATIPLITGDDLAIEGVLTETAGSENR